MGGKVSRAGRLVAVVAVASLVTAMTMGVAGATKRPSGPANAAITSCRAVLDGTVAEGSKLAALKARSCAIACGLLADGRRLSKDPVDEATLLKARETCLEACPVITEVSLNAHGRRGQSEFPKDPISIAAAACLQALTTGANALPVTDSSGRRWR